MSNKREFKIGEEIQFGLLTLVCEEDIVDMGCEECIFCDISSSIGCVSLPNDYLGNCSKASRTDNKNVIFKLKEE